MKTRGISNLHFSGWILLSLVTSLNSGSYVSRLYTRHLLISKRHDVCISILYRQIYCGLVAKLHPTFLEADRLPRPHSFPIHSLCNPNCMARRPPGVALSKRSSFIGDRFKAIVSDPRIVAGFAVDGFTLQTESLDWVRISGKRIPEMYTIAGGGGARVCWRVL